MSYRGRIPARSRPRRTGPPSVLSVALSEARPPEPGTRHGHVPQPRPAPERRRAAHASAGKAGALRPALRARCLRRGLRRAPRRPPFAPHRRAGPAGTAQPRPPRRLRLRGQHRRRRRHPRADAAWLQRRGLRESAPRAAGARRVRQRPDLPATQPDRAPQDRGEVRAGRAGRGPARDRLAHGADQRRDARRDGPLLRAVHAPGVHPPQPGPRGRTRVRAQAVRDPQARLHRDPHLDDGRRRILVRGQPVLPHAGVQGHAADLAAGPVLPRPAQPGARVGARAGALALQHQHLPELGPRAPVPLHRPQRRNQHGARQHQLDACARGALRVRAVRRGHPRDQPDREPERQRLGHVRQRARAAVPLGALVAARDDDDDPRAVVEPRIDGRRQARLLPVPLLADGALGRAGGDLLHRRHADWRGTRPQRPASRALLGHEGRPRRARLRDRRARHRRRKRRREGPRAAGPDVPGRHGAGSHHRRRGDQAAGRHATPVPRLARPVPDPPRRPAGGARSAAARPGHAAAAPGRLRLHLRGRAHRAGADGARRRRGRRLDGQRHAARGAVEPAAPALRLLQAAVRAGHEPADRLHPRRDRDVGRDPPRLRGQPAQSAAGRLPPARAQVADPDQRGVRESPAHGPAGPAGGRAADAVPRQPRREGPGQVDGGAAADGAAPDRGGRGQRPRAQRPRRQQGLRADPGADGRRGPAPLPDPRGIAHARQHRARDRRGARGASLRAADRLRRERDQSLPRLRVDRADDRAGHARRRRPPHGLQEPGQGRGQGRHQGRLEDGHLLAAELPRRAGVRGRRPAPGRDRRLLQLDTLAHRRHRHRRDRAGGAGAPRGRVPGAARRSPDTAGRRPVPVARRR